MVLKGTSDEHSQSNLNPSRNNLVIGPDFQPHSLVENRTLQLVALVVSGKNFLQREKAVSFTSDTCRSGTAIIMNLPGDSGIAGVVNGVLIPFDVI